MGLMPEKMAYLAEASRFLGNMEEDSTPQRAEPLEAFRQDYAVLESFTHIKSRGSKRTLTRSAEGLASH
jgi:hypothetical protein